MDNPEGFHFSTDHMDSVIVDPSWTIWATCRILQYSLLKKIFP